MLRKDMEIIIRKLVRSFGLTSDLIHSLSEADLSLKLKDLPSNKIGEQIWCMVGARESYFKAIKNSKWSGFNCSLENAFSKDEVLDCLSRTQEEIIDFLNQNKLSETQAEIMLDLLEHEIQHHGQLIRYFYGNKLEFPKSWNERYTV